MKDQVHLRDRVQHHVDTIYHDNPLNADLTGLADELLALMRLEGNVGLAQYPVYHWDQRDTVVITYGDSLLRAGEKPLRTLKTFLDEHSDFVRQANRIFRDMNKTINL